MPKLALLSFVFSCLFVVPLFSDEEDKPVKAPAKKAEAVEEPREFEEVALELFRKKKLFDKRSYPELRKAFAYSFSLQEAYSLQEAWGSESEPFRKYMDEHPGIRELLFISINPGQGGDNVIEALKLMKQIWEKYPKQFEEYPSLAIAVSLVWDRPGGALHGSPVGQHKATEISQPADAMTNFYYCSHAERFMGDRVRHMPWEFLTLLVNHRTSLAERKWAVENYLAKRQGIGKIYGEVPYDHPMLSGSDPKLTGMECTLPNQRKYGGVCSCQADFATRTAKSIGVPAFDAGGEARFGGGHAWVMWFEIDNLSAQGMRCNLLSEGRYSDDHYYVGHTAEPWSSTSTTDRALGMKLFGIGRDTTAYRQSELILKAYRHIAAKEAFTPRQQLDFYAKTIDLNPFATEAWRGIAELARGGVLEKKDTNTLKKYFGLLFKTFAQHPDFTWEVFDDLISFEPWKKQRGENYGKLCSMYESAKRPDLALKARLHYARLLVEEDRIPDALKGMAGTCLMFPEEGAIIPGVLDQMDQLCKYHPEKSEANYRSMAAFYKAFLPKIPQKRGGSPSSYCMNMYERGIKVFEMVGETSAANHFKAELQKLRASGN